MSQNLLGKLPVTYVRILLPYLKKFGLIVLSTLTTVGVLSTLTTFVFIVSIAKRLMLVTKSSSVTLIANPVFFAIPFVLALKRKNAHVFKKPLSFATAALSLVTNVLFKQNSNIMPMLQIGSIAKD